MANRISFEFGRPEERSYFTKSYHRFLGCLENLHIALNTVFIKEDTYLKNAEIVMDTLCKICADDFNEILLLCANGFGNGALKILRGMYEKIVVARYFHLHPEEVNSFWNYHTVKLSKLKLDDILQKVDPNGEKLNQFKVARKPGGRKRLQSSWSTVDFAKMAEEVKLDKHLRNAYHYPLEFAHPSVTSILALWERTNGQLTIKENEPQRRTAKTAIIMAHYLLLEVLRLQIEHYDLNVEDSIFQKCLNDFVSIWKKDSPGT